MTAPAPAVTDREATPIIPWGEKLAAGRGFLAAQSRFGLAQTDSYIAGWLRGETGRALVAALETAAVVRARNPTVPRAAAAQDDAGWSFDMDAAPRDGTVLMLFARWEQATACSIVIGWWFSGDAEYPRAGWIAASFAGQPIRYLICEAWQHRPAFPVRPDALAYHDDVTSEGIAAVQAPAGELRPAREWKVIDDGSARLPKPHARFDLDRMSEAIRALPGAPVMGRAIGDRR